MLAEPSRAAGSEASVGLIARYGGDGEGNGYLAEMYGTPGLTGLVTVDLYRRQGGALTRLATRTTAANSGRMEFILTGPTLTLRLGSTTLLTASDTTFAAGSAGIRLAGPIGTAVDNFGVS